MRWPCWPCWSAPRVGRHALARVGHRLQALGQRVHDDVRERLRVVVAGLAPERLAARSPESHRTSLRNGTLRFAGDRRRRARRVAPAAARPSRGFSAPRRVDVAAVAVARVRLEVQLLEVAVRRVSVAAVVRERVVDHVVAPLVVQATALAEDRRVLACRRCTAGRCRDTATRITPHALLLTKRLFMIVSLRPPDTDMPVPTGPAAAEPAAGALESLLSWTKLWMNTQQVGAPATGGETPGGQAPF